MKRCAPGGAHLFSLRVISFTQRFVTVSSISCFSITLTETKRKSLLQKFPFLSVVKVRLFITRILDDMKVSQKPPLFGENKAGAGLPKISRHYTTYHPQATRKRLHGSVQRPYRLGGFQMVVKQRRYQEMVQRQQSTIIAYFQRLSTFFHFYPVPAIKTCNARPSRKKPEVKSTSDYLFN